MFVETFVSLRSAALLRTCEAAAAGGTHGCEVLDVVQQQDKTQEHRLVGLGTTQRGSALLGREFVIVRYKSSLEDFSQQLLFCPGRLFVLEIAADDHKCDPI